MELSQFYNRLKQDLAEFGVESPDLEARMMLKHRLDIDWAQIIADPERKIPENDVKLLEDDLKRRMSGEPLARIHGFRQFHGLEFTLGPDTLDPRPETEILIDRALELFKSRPPENVLDL